jgi:GMP synthase (glutamine-hydrolysing)
VISGAHAMITDDLPWMLRLADWTRRVVTAQVPFLGICFGHQMLARAMGGKVDFHPRGREIGSVDIALHAAAESDFVRRHAKTVQCPRRSRPDGQQAAVRRHVVGE